MPLEVEGINGEKYTFPVKAYAVDKPCGSEKHILRDQLKMGSFHCCDYIYVDENKILLLEDSNLKAKKDDLENRCLCSVEDEKTKGKLCREIIRKEQVLKAYGSLLLQYRLILQDKQSKELMEGKEVYFWVIVNDADISDSRAFEHLASSLRGSLKPIISDVAVLPLEQAKNELCKYAGSNP